MKFLFKKKLIALSLFLLFFSLYSCAAFLNPVKISDYSSKDDISLKNFYLPKIKQNKIIIKKFMISYLDKKPEIIYIKNYYLNEDDKLFFISEVYDSEKILIEKNKELISEYDSKLTKFKLFFKTKTETKIYEAEISSNITFLWDYTDTKSEGFKENIIDFTIKNYKAEEDVEFTSRVYINRTFLEFDKYATSYKAFDIAIIKDRYNYKAKFTESIIVEKEFSDIHYYAEDFGLIHSYRYKDGELIMEKEFIEYVNNKDFVSGK